MSDTSAACAGLYTGGSLAGAIIGTFCATLILLGLIYLVWEWQKKRRVKRSGLHNLVIVEDGGGGSAGGGDTKGYDNPGFIDESSDVKKSHDGKGLDAKFNGAGKPTSQQNGEKKMPWGPLSFLFKSRSALDDSVVEEPQKYNVALKGHDFTGLGFSICGNMRDGIFVKDIMQRGPAAESKQILPGDQITGMTVSFKQMVLEDAITLLSYASPYEVTLDMLRLPEKSLPHKGIMVSSPSHPSVSSGQSNTLERVCHPFFKSQSIDDLRKVGKEHLDLQVDRKKKQANGIHASKTSSTSVTGGTEIPTVVVVGNNENRSSSSPSKASTSFSLPKLPKMNFSLGSSSASPKSSKAPKANQKSSTTSSSSAQIQIAMPDETDGPIVSVTKPEIIPRTKTKSSHVQKATDDMELVEAISPAIEKMTEEFEKNKKDMNDSLQKAAESVDAAVLDVQPVEINMSGQPSVNVEAKEIELPTAKIDVPSAEVDVRAPSMMSMFGVKSNKGEKKEKKDKSKEKEGKDKSAGKQSKEKEKSSKKSKALDIDLTPLSISIKGGVELGESENEDKAEQQEVKKPQRGQKSKDKTEKSKEKDVKAGSSKQEKESQGKEASPEESSNTTSSGEKSKFFKFGIPVLPDISLNFGFGGNKSSSGEDKEKEKEKENEKDQEKRKNKESSSTEEMVAEISIPNLEQMKSQNVKEKSPEPAVDMPLSPKELKKEKKEKEAKEKKEKEAKEKEAKEKEAKEKKEKELKEKSSKDKSKGKDESTTEQSSAEKGDEPSESSPPQKEKSGSSFSFNIKLPSFDKPLLKRKDSSSSNSGEKPAESSVEISPKASDPTESKVEMPAMETSPKKSKKKSGKSEKKEKNSSRPTSPEVSEGHRTTDDEADKTDVIDSTPGEKTGKKGSGFHMPHIGIKLPKFGHSKQTYSFENAGDNKDLKHSHGPTAEALLEASPVKMEVSANAPEFRKMTPTQEDIMPEITVKMEQPSFAEPSSSTVKAVKDEVDSSEVKVEIDAPKVTLPSASFELPSASMKMESFQKEGSAAPSEPEEKGETKMDKASEDEMNKKDQEKEKDVQKEKEQKPSFVSKGLKGLRDLKDKVAHKLSHDPHGSASSSEDEDAGGDDKMTKEKVKKEKKSKEARDKSKEDKQREKEEKAKEKERIKAEKKLKKAEMKKKAASAAQSSSSSSSSSSDESDADDGNAKVEKKEKKKSKTKDSKSAKEKKSSRKDKKGDKSEKKSSGIEVKVEMLEVDPQTPVVAAQTSIEQTQIAGHEAKLIPVKPPVVPRKSRDSAKDVSIKADTNDENSVPTIATKLKLKKTKSKGGMSTSSSSSSSESDSESSKKEDREGKPKKPKRSPKRKAPEIPIPTLSHTLPTYGLVPDVIKITTSAEVSSPPKEEVSKKAGSEQQNAEMRESTPSKTPESGRRSASFGDLSSLQQPKPKVEGPLERAMSMDMAGDQENAAEAGVIPTGSSTEDLSKVPDSKTITHLSRNQQPAGLRDSVASRSSTSSSETLKESPTSIVQVHPKELTIVTSEISQVAPTTTITVSSSTTMETPSQQEAQSSTIQQMMNETLSVINNIVHEMDSPSLVKSIMKSTSSTESSQPAKVTISTPSPTAAEQQEAKKVAEEAVDEIVEKATQSLMPEATASVSFNLHEDYLDTPKVSVTTGDGSKLTSEMAHELSPDIMESGADSFSIASVKIQGLDGDSEELVSVRNITVTNIKNESTPVAETEPIVTAQVPIMDEEIPSEEPSPSTSADAANKQLLREDSKARLLQTVADANEIKVSTPLRKDSSLSSSSCSVDSTSETKSEVTATIVKPIFTIDGEEIAPEEKAEEEEKTNGQTIEISSAELDGIMMSHADFLQKQAAALDDSLDDPENLQQQLKDTFDNWVYVEQKNAAHEHTCQHSHSDPEPSTSSSNDDDEGPYSRNGALSPTTYRMETEYKFETSEMRVTSSPIPPEEAHVKSQSTVYSTTMTLPQKTVTQITLGDPVVDAGGRIVSKITLDTSASNAEDAGAAKGSSATSTEVDLGKLPKLESLK